MIDWGQAKIPASITLIPNGVMVGSWKPDPAKRKEIRRQWGITEEQFVAIYTGAHGPANALEVVVKAGVHLESGISIVLMGDGPEKEKLIRLKEELGLDHVHLMPPVPKQEVYDYIYAADCSSSQRSAVSSRPGASMRTESGNRSIVTASRRPDRSRRVTADAAAPAGLATSPLINEKSMPEPRCLSQASFSVHNSRKRA